MVLILFVLIVLFVVMNTFNVNYNYSLQEKQNTHTKLLEDNKILFLQIESANDLKVIGKRAEEELGMIFPKKIEYINE